MQPASEWLDKCVTGLTAGHPPVSPDATAGRVDKIRLWPFCFICSTIDK